MNLRAPTDYFSVFKLTTRPNWDLLTPLALFGPGFFGIAFIYSAQFSSKDLHGSTAPERRLDPRSKSDIHV